MRSKLVLVFDDGDEINDVPKVLIFNNVLDAERYFLDSTDIVKIKIEPEDLFFSFTCIWSGTGRAYWATEPF